MTQKSNLLLGYLMALTVVCIWSGFIVISRYGTTNELLGYDLIALRYGVATLLAIPLWLIFSRQHNIFSPRYVLLALFGGVIYAFCAFSAFGLAPASHAAVFLPGFMPVAITLCLWLLLGHKINAKGLFSLAVISAGVALLAANTLTVDVTTLRGDLLFMAAATSWGVFNALLRKWHPDPIATMAAVSFYTCILYLPIYLFLLPKQLPTAPFDEIALQAIYQGIVAAVLQLILYVKAAKAIGAANMAVTMAFVPVLASLLAIPALDEQINWIIGFSLFCVTAGAIYGNVHGNKKGINKSDLGEVLQE